MKELLARFEALSDPHGIMIELGISATNPALHVKQLLEQDLEAGEALVIQAESTQLLLDSRAQSIAYIAKRRREYPGLDEILHTILDHGLDSPEMAAIQQKRQEIKAKHPKGS